MAELKRGWKRVKFGEVVRQVKDNVEPSTSGLERYVAGEHMDTDDLRIRRWGNIGDGYLGPAFHMRFRPGQVLYGSRRTYLRKVALPDFEGVCANTTFVLESSDPRVLLPELLPFIMQTEAFHAHSVRESKGSVNPYVNFSDLAWYEFALPPVEEQRRQVIFLRSRADLVDSYRRLINAIDIAESSLLLKEFGTYSLDAAQNMRRLAEVAVVHTGIAKGREHQPGKTLEVPYLRVANVKDGELDLSDIQNIVVEQDRLPNYLLRRGDVLMTEGGDLDKLGRGTVWEGQVEGCVHQNHVFAVRTSNQLLLPWYLAALARSSFGRGYFQKCAKRTSNLASINKREIEACPVPVRSVEAQAQFVSNWIQLRDSRQAARKRMGRLQAELGSSI